jgi:hypothetical protein
VSIPCVHWSDCGIKGAGRCALGLYGGTPSAGTCLRICPDYEGPPRRPVPSTPFSKCKDDREECAAQRLLATLAKIGKGGLAFTKLGLSKLGLRDDIAPTEVMDQRWETCGSCDRNIRGWCAECDCNLPAKVMLTMEQCPLSKW